MTIRKFALAAAAFACPAFIYSAPVQAQSEITTQPTIPPPVPPPYIVQREAAPEHYDLFAAVMENFDNNVLIDQIIAALSRQFATDPNLATLDQRSPGTINELAESARPILTVHVEHEFKIYEQRVAALFARHLTASEAQEVADFYRSDIGKRISGLAMEQNLQLLDNADLASSSEDSEEGYERDREQAKGAIMDQLSQEELAQIEQTARSSPAMLKLRRLQPDMADLRSQMRNAPLSPETTKAIQDTMREVIARRFPR